MRFGKISPRVEEKWSGDYYTCVCRILDYWIKNDPSEIQQRRSAELLRNLITYGVVMDNTPELAEEGDTVSVKLFYEEYAYLHELLGLYAAGIPDDTQLDTKTDYLFQCKEETRKYREEKERKRKEREAWLEQEKRRKQEEKLAKQKAEWDAVKAYIIEHASEPIVKKAMAIDLKIPYSRCLKIYKEVISEMP